MKLHRGGISVLLVLILEDFHRHIFISCYCRWPVVSNVAKDGLGVVGGDGWLALGPKADFQVQNNMFTQA